jgi:hypothetical protein
MGWLKSEQELIDEEIENALELYSDEFYKRILAIREFRHQLIVYVLERVESASVDLKGKQHLLSKTKFPYRSLELRLRIEQYIMEGIEQILQINSDALARYIPKDCNLSYSSSC